MNDDWQEYFWGEVVSDEAEFNRREVMYQAFKGRFLDETRDKDSS